MSNRILFAAGAFTFGSSTLIGFILSQKNPEGRKVEMPDANSRMSTYDVIAQSYDSMVGWDENVMGMWLLRKWLVKPNARGEVLEVATGTGRNLSLYQEVRKLISLQYNNRPYALHSDFFSFLCCIIKLIFIHLTVFSLCTSHFYSNNNNNNNNNKDMCTSLTLTDSSKPMLEQAVATRKQKECKVPIAVAVCTRHASCTLFEFILCIWSQHIPNISLSHNTHWLSFLSN
jgi:hypothetical protein